MVPVTLYRFTILLIAACLSTCAFAAGPNIVFFLVDDYDKSETSCYGGKVLTPNLDRLAAEGMRLDNMYMTSTVCTPSRYTCLTGRYAGSSYSKVYRDLFPLGQQGLPAFNVALEHDGMNVGRVLSDNGYETGFVGKYHVGDEHGLGNLGGNEIPKTVEYTEKIAKDVRKNQRVACKLIREEGFSWAKNVYWNNVKEPLKGHNPEWTIDAALEFIDQNKAKPFYLHYCTTLLHGPNKEWYRSLDKPLVTGAGMLSEPIGLMDRDSVMQRVRAAGLTEEAAGYTWMDDSLGLLLDRLDRHGIVKLRRSEIDGYFKVAISAPEM